MKRIIVFLLLLLIFSTTGCSRTENYSSVTSNPTPVSIEHVPSQNATQVPENTKALITPNTPTPQPDPYIFSTSGGYVDLSFGLISIDITEGPLKNTKVETTIISSKNLGGFGSTSEGFNELGSGIGIARPDKYGNLLITVHSSYHCISINVCEDALEAEPWRFSLEAWGSSERYIEKNLEEIENTKGSLTVNDISIPVEILGGVRLEHNEEESVSKNPEQIVDIVTKKNSEGYIAIGNADIFEDLKNGSHKILIDFCGWGPKEDSYQDYSYYRYVILLEIKEELQTPESVN